MKMLTLFKGEANQKIISGIKTPQFLEKSKKSLADGGSSGKLLTKGSLKKKTLKVWFLPKWGFGKSFGFFLWHF